jgi:hypothetical protein
LLEWYIVYDGDNPAIATLGARIEALVSSAPCYDEPIIPSGTVVDRPVIIFGVQQLGEKAIHRRASVILRQDEYSVLKNRIGLRFVPPGPIFPGWRLDLAQGRREANGKTDRVVS